jgi:hypothetical protein
MSLPPNFMFAGLRGGNKVMMPIQHEQGVMIQGMDDDDDGGRDDRDGRDSSRRRVLDFGKDAEGRGWTSNGLGLGTAFAETREEEGKVDFVQW